MTGSIYLYLIGKAVIEGFPTDFAAVAGVDDAFLFTVDRSGKDPCC